MHPSPLNSVEFIKKLVEFDTTSYLSNLGLIEYIREYLEHYGIESVLAYSEDKTKANLYATIGPSGKPGVMLSGHTDVVPVTGQKWSTEPFRVVEKEGRLLGRGTADMKSFIAIALACVPQLVKANLNTPTHLAFSYDEEIGCVGVRRLLSMMEGMPVRPAMCIVGEPTNMKVFNAHKGKESMRVKVTGLEAHSSIPGSGVNAIDYALELMNLIRRIARDFSREGPFEDGYNVTHSTVHIGRIIGGTAVNIVPRHCEFDFEIRNIPDHDPQPVIDQIIGYARQTLEPKMKAVDPGCGFEFESIGNYPGMFTSPDEAVVAFVKSLAETEEISKTSFGTEGGLFTRQLGIPTVVCGPGNIEQAHKPNEFIELQQVQQMERFMQRLIHALTGS